METAEVVHVNFRIRGSRKRATRGQLSIVTRCETQNDVCPDVNEYGYRIRTHIRIRGRNLSNIRWLLHFQL